MNGMTEKEILRDRFLREVDMLLPQSVDGVPLSTDPMLTRSGEGSVVMQFWCGDISGFVTASAKEIAMNAGDIPALARRRVEAAIGGLAKFKAGVAA